MSARAALRASSAEGYAPMLTIACIRRSCSGSLHGHFYRSARTRTVKYEGHYHAFPFDAGWSTLNFMTTTTEKRGRVIGIGGIFLKSSDHDRLRSWYWNNLGLEHENGYSQFKWRSHEKPEVDHVTAWS